MAEYKCEQCGFRTEVPSGRPAPTHCQTPMMATRQVRHYQ